MNPATAFATVIVDELIRCGLADAVLAPGSRSAPLAMALWRRAQEPGTPAAAPPPGWPEPDGETRPGRPVRLHVRIDERSAAFLALGLAKAGGRPVAVVCTSGTAAAHVHAAVIEADQACVPLIVLTADRPPELRGTGANQAIDQVKLYGGAVRWFAEVGVPEARAGMNGYWRSLAGRAWGAATGAAGGPRGPVHLNVALREPLVPGLPDQAAAAVPGGAGGEQWPEPLAGRAGGAPWVGFPAGARAVPARPGAAGALTVPWTERAVVVCGDGDYDPAPLLELAETAGWPVLAEPSSGARRGPNALSAYPYLLVSAEFLAAHRPELIVSAGRPSLSRGQLAFLKGASPARTPPRHVVVGQEPGHWADPARTATDVAAALRLDGAAPGGGRWLADWLAADGAARRAADQLLAGEVLTEPGLARDLAAQLPDGALLWAASSLPIRDLDHHMAAREGVRVLANRGASGIDGLVSAAIGAALAHQAGGGGPAVALLGDLAFLHDAPGLFLGAAEPRPDLVIVVVDNDGGGIFSTLEQASFPGLFERIFGTPHGADLAGLAAAAGLPVTALERPGELARVLAGAGLRVVTVRTSRAAGASLRERLRTAACAAVASR